MSTIELYKAFRNEMMDYIAEDFLMDCDVSEILYKGDIVGFVCTAKDGWIEGCYVEPNYRGCGLAKQAVLDHIAKYGMPNHLTVLNRNVSAMKFWESIFELKAEDSNRLETSYEIVGLR